MSPYASSEIKTAIQEIISKCSHIGERYIFEFLATIIGLKSVLRVQIADDHEYALLQKFSELVDLSITHSPTRMKVAWINSLGDTFLTSVPWSDPEGTSYASYLSKSLCNAKEAATLESNGTAEDIGELLGYPQCCCIAYEQLQTGEFWVPLLTQNSPDNHYSPLANRYAYLLYDASLFPDYFPCNLGCDGTQELSRKIILMSQDNGMADMALFHLDLMRRPVVIGDGFLAGFPVGIDTATTIFPNIVVYEWVQGSAIYLPDITELLHAFQKKTYALEMTNKSEARIIYFDQ